VALTEAQRSVIISGLGAAREYGFALAGSGALIEHGIATRATDDADWFSTMEHEESFDAAVAAVTERLQRDGFTLEPIKRSDTFFKFGVTTPSGEVVEIDMSLDWRRYNPAEIAIGPVLDIQDAAAAKVATIFSRGEARDFVDLWAIRSSSLWTDSELFAMAQDRDAGIDPPMFASMLSLVDKYDDRRFSAYGLNPDEITEVRAGAAEFADHIQTVDPSEFVVPEHGGEVHVRGHAHARNGYTRHHWRSRPTRKS
jgi:hypothetical protein